LTPDRRTLLALFSLAFGVRILYAVLLGNDPSVIPMHETYAFRVAASMAAGWSWLTTPFSPAPPGYLIALAAVFRVAGVSWWTAVLFNTVLGAGTVLLLYRIGEQRLGRLVGLASALWLGASVSQIHYASLAIRDVMTTFLLVWLTYSLVRSFHRMRTAVWSGFLFILLVYTEPMFALLLPVVVIFLALRATRHRVLNLQYVFLFIATVFVLAVPWTIRNYVVYRELIPISLKASRYTSPAPLRDRAGTAGNAATPEGTPGFLHNTVEYWRFARFAESPGNPAIGVRPEPAWSFRHNAATILSFGILLPFLAVGAGFAWRKRQRAPMVLAGVVLCHAILRGFLGGSEEARLPAEPLIILLAFYGLRELLEARRGAGEPASTAS
jgi:4-amino-4-deoxy-L-arabinose transferase-like glycosyltransferase